MSFLPVPEALYSLALLSDATKESSLLPLLPAPPCLGHTAPLLAQGLGFPCVLRLSLVPTTLPPNSHLESAIYLRQIYSFGDPKP